MTKRIIGYVLTALLIVSLLIITLTIQATTNVIGKKEEVKLRDLLDILYSVYSTSGTSFIDSLETEDYNITVFSPEGEIVNGSYSLIADRKAVEKFLASLTSTPGEIVSTNTAFLFGSLALAGVCTSDGMIILVSTTINTFGDTLIDMRIELLYILLVCVLVSSLTAKLISYLVVEPLNRIDTDSPGEVDGGKYREILPLINKITEQKEDIAAQQEELKAGKKRFRAISETLTEGMVLIEKDRTISYINHSAVSYLALRGDPTGMDYASVFDETLGRIIDATINSGAQKSTIYRGNSAWQVETSHLTNEGGDYNGVSMLIYDVTDEVNLENDRRIFTANVSHELKTPLQIISGSAELLELGIVKEEDRKTFINQIYKETKRMKELIDDILKLSKLDEHKDGVEKEVLSVREEALRVIESLSGFASRKSVSLMVKGTDGRIECNRFMFSQILYNLVDNAVKYTNEHGSVEVEITEDGDSLFIDVRDDGIGIPEEYHRKIFERFFRVDKSRSKEVGGTGLGLAIVRNCCLENGGDVEVESSTVGKGTTFRVTFPLYKGRG